MISRALRRLGHQVFEYAKIYESQTWVSPNGREFNSGMPEILRGYSDYDLVLFTECNDPEPQYLELKEVKTRKRFGWFFDTSYYPGVVGALAHRMEFDHVFSANPLYKGDFWTCPSTWLPYAADAERHVRLISHDRTIPFGLVGTERKDRKMLIRKLKRKGVDAHLISNVFCDNYVNALASSLVQINQNPREGRGLMNMRQFEAPAAGALILAQHGDFVEQAFEPDEECLLYTDEDDLVRLCQELKNDPVRVQKIREAGHARVLRDHTYDVRAREICEKVHSQG